MIAKPALELHFFLVQCDVSIVESIWREMRKSTNDISVTQCRETQQHLTSPHPHPTPYNCNA